MAIEILPSNIIPYKREELISSIRERLVNQGVPIGQADAVARNMAQTQLSENAPASGGSSWRTPANLAMQNISNFTPEQIIAMQSRIYDPKNYENITDNIPMLPFSETSMPYTSGRSSVNINVRKEYEDAINMYSNILNRQYAQRGVYLPEEQLRRIVQDYYIGDISEFERRRGVQSQIYDKSKDNLSLLGSAVAFGTGAGKVPLRSGVLPLVSRLAADVTESSFLPGTHSRFNITSPAYQLRTAFDAYKAALATNNPYTIDAARRAYGVAAQNAKKFTSHVFGAMGPAFALAFGGQEALGRNLRGETPLEHLGRLFNTRPNIDPKEIAMDDWSRFGFALPTAVAAQAGTFNTIPRALFSGALSTGGDAITRAVTGGARAGALANILQGIAQMAPDVGTLALGSEKAKNLVNKRLLNTYKQLLMSSKRGEGIGNIYDITAPESLLGFLNRGIFSKRDPIKDDESALRYTFNLENLGRLGTTVGDMFSLPAVALGHLAGGATDIAQTAARGLGSLSSPLSPELGKALLNWGSKTEYPTLVRMGADPTKWGNYLLPILASNPAFNPSMHRTIDREAQARVAKAYDPLSDPAVEKAIKEREALINNKREPVTYNAKRLADLEIETAIEKAREKQRDNKDDTKTTL